MSEAGPANRSPLLHPLTMISKEARYLIIIASKEDKVISYSNLNLNAGHHRLYNHCICAHPYPSPLATLSKLSNLWSRQFYFQQSITPLLNAYQLIIDQPLHHSIILALELSSSPSSSSSLFNSTLTNTNNSS